MMDRARSRKSNRANKQHADWGMALRMCLQLVELAVFLTSFIFEEALWEFVAVFVLYEYFTAFYMEEVI